MINLFIPNYISSQVYKVEKNKLIAYISDEKNLSYIQLEGSNAHFWKNCIAQNKKNGQIYIKKINNVVLHLLSLGLLVKQKDVKEDVSLFYAEKEKYTKEKMYNSYLYEKQMDKLLYKNGYLPSLFIELTYNCNLNCIHCFNPKNKNHLSLKLDKMKKIIDDAFDMGVFSITLSGGECTLDKDFLEICKYIRKKGILLNIFTNGQFFYDNPLFFNDFLSLYPHSVSLSLYSMNPQIHDEIVGEEGAHYKTLTIINELQKRNINVTIKIFLMKNNAKEYQDIIDFANKINVMYQLDECFIYNQENNNLNIKIIDEQLFNLYSDDLYKYILNNSSKRNIKKQTFLQKKPCRAGHIFLTITPNLDVTPCNNLYEFKLGNLENESLWEIWHNRKNKNKLYKWQLIRKKHFKECFTKSYCKFCHFCPGKIEREGFLFKTSSILCENAQIKEQVFNAKK